MLSTPPLTEAQSRFTANNSTATKAAFFAIQLTLSRRLTSHTAIDLTQDFLPNLFVVDTRQQIGATKLGSLVGFLIVCLN